jgi:hypothetical protein
MKLGVPLLVAVSVCLGGCSRDEVSHARVAKLPTGGDDALASQASHRAPSPPPGMGGGEVDAPPAPDTRLAWTLPKGWTDERTGGMRYATLKVPVKGRIDASVVVLPGPAGGELMNVNRWRNQIGLPPIDEPALAGARRPVASKAGTLSVYDFTSEGQKQSRVVAGLLEAGGSTWFVKMTGDADAVTAARSDFLALLGSLHLE